MLHRIDEELVVNLIGENHQAVARSDLQNSSQRLAAADGSRGIAGVDDDDGPCLRIPLGIDAPLDVIQVRLPAVLLIALIGDRFAAEFHQRGFVERVAGRGDQDAVARIEQRRETDFDGFTHAGGNKHLLNAADALALGLRANGAQRLLDSRGGSIAIVPRQHGLEGGLDDMARRQEIVGRRVPDIQAQQLLARCLSLLSHQHNVSNGVAHALGALRRDDLVRDRSNGPGRAAGLFAVRQERFLPCPGWRTEASD